MTEDSVRQALLAVSARQPQPLDPTCEISTSDACRLIKTSNPDTLRRILLADGWTVRRARLPNGRIGEVWRLPSAQSEDVVNE